MLKRKRLELCSCGFVFEVNCSKMILSLFPGHPGGHRAPVGRPNGPGAGATIARESATGPASIESWRESVTGRGRRGKAGTETGRGGTEGTGKGDAPVARTETESAREAAAVAGTVGASARRRKGTAGMTGAGGRTGITIKTEALRGRGPGIRRAGERLTTAGTRTIGKGTGTRGRPKGPAGVEAERGDTKVGQRRRAGNGSAATAGRGTGREMENSALTNAVAAKRGATISESPAMTIVDIEAVRASSKCCLAAILLVFFLLFFYIRLSALSLVLKRRNSCTSDIWICCLWLMLLYVFPLFHSPLDHR